VEHDARVGAEVLARLDELSNQSRLMLVKHAIENPDEWKSLSSEKQQLDWAIKVFYGTYPEGAPIAVGALLSLTNASDTRVAGLAAFVLGVCHIRDTDYESARGTLACALDRFLGGQTVEEYAADAREEDKDVVDKLLRARAVLARKTNATPETDSDVYWSHALVRLWSDRAGQCQRWNLLVNFAHALMRAGQRAQAVQTLEKALELRRSTAGSVKDRYDDQLRRWKNGESDSEAYDL